MFHQYTYTYTRERAHITPGTHERMQSVIRARARSVIYMITRALSLFFYLAREKSNSFAHEIREKSILRNSALARAKQR